MYGFEFGKNRDEKIDKFLDNLAWHFSSKQIQDLTARAVTKLTEEIKVLETTIKKADESSSKLATALNRLTLWGVIVVGTGILAALIQFLFENKIWPFSQ